jgi:hypothetical protein
MPNCGDAWVKGLAFMMPYWEEISLDGKSKQ